MSRGNDNDAPHLTRRNFLEATAALGAAWTVGRVFGGAAGQERPMETRPNVLFVFADQWRKQAVGYENDPNVKTPHLDALKNESINFSTTVSCCPVCSPYRASLLTGQYPLTHGIFLNDAHLRREAVSIAEAFNAGGYDTAYVGKWHLHGRGRARFIPKEDRQGFDFWRVLECTHNYNQSPYYGDEDRKLLWPGYDAQAQTECLREYLRGRNGKKPFIAFLSWGPPHNPYETAPQKFKDLYDPQKLVLRPNVPKNAEAKARTDLAGYYAHCSALDQYLGELLDTLKETGLAENTLVVFTSDHGDMLHSQGQERKQRPWDESILVPFLLRLPANWGRKPLEIATPFNAPDIMPTLLSLCDLPIPKTTEGRDFGPLILGREQPPQEAVALIACYHPFGEWMRTQGGKEYRSIRTERFTYVRDLNGPWLLYDNQADPHQLQNLINQKESADLQQKLDGMLNRLLAEQNDHFLPSAEYVKKWNYNVGKNGTLPTAP
jgi:arylsulfatase A-like enzyme